MTCSRIVAIVLFVSFISTQPAYALPLIVIDPAQRLTTTEGNATTHFLYDGLNAILERDALGKTQSTYTRGLSYGGGIGGILSALRGSQRSHYHYDGLGSVTGLTDSASKATQIYTYDAFGNLLTQAGQVQNPYRFSSKEYSPTSGLVYFGARYYDPRIGRFLTPDPLGMIDGPNLYLYAGANPVLFSDPWGLDYWIEGSSSAGEPGSHQSINVGDPNGAYDSYSFGVNGDINLRYGLEGAIYRDPLKGGPIDPARYRKTPSEQDAVIKAWLESQVGKKGSYGPWSTCRNFSQDAFLALSTAGYGQSAAPPDRPQVMGQPSQSVPFISSTITLSEPYGFPSASTNKNK
jgi:RHS repeat-associated protein